MSSISSTSLSGMNAAQAMLGSSAHNVANVNTANFRRQQLVQSEQANGGVATSIRPAGAEGSALEEDVVTQLQAKNAFLANLRVFKTSDAMAGSLLDMKA